MTRMNLRAYQNSLRSQAQCQVRSCSLLSENTAALQAAICCALSIAIAIPGLLIRIIA